MVNRSIAIVGISFNLPGMDRWQEAKNKFVSGESCINELSENRREDVFGRFGEFQIKASGYLDRVDLFDNKFFGITENEAINMSPEERNLLIYALKSFSHAGYSKEKVKGTKTGVFFSSSASMYDAFFDEARGIGDQTPGIEGTRVANFFDLRGPVIDFNTTCSSSLTALHYACNSLRSEECDMALVGGVKISVNEKTVMDKQVITSKSNACRPFDKDADGTLAGEGTVCIVVKRWEDAIKDQDYVYGVIEGSAINHGGSRTSSLVAPSPEAQTEVIVDAWRKSGIDPSELRFIEAHGTGTILGDPIEYKGIVDAFKECNCDDRNVSISSIKGQVGHLDTMSGLAGLIRLLVALNENTIFPQTGFTALNDHIQSQSGINVPLALEPWHAINGKRVGGISSFGLTGTNVHIVVSREEHHHQVSPDSTYYFQLGANSENKLEDLKNYLLEYVSSNENIRLHELENYVNSVFTLEKINQGLTVSSREELIQKLSKKEQPESSDVFLILNLSILHFGTDEIEAIFSENKKIEDCWNVCTSNCDYKAIENDVLRSTLFQYTICYYFKDLLKKEVVFICRQDENTVHHLLEGKISVEDVVNSPDQIQVGKAPFNKEAFLAYVNKMTEGKSITAVHFDDQLEIATDLETTGATVIDGRFDPENRYSFYQQMLLKGKNALEWKKQQLPIADGFLPVLELKRFWPKVKSLALSVGTQPAQELEEQTTDSSGWNYDSVRNCVGAIWMDYLDLEEHPDLKDDFFKIGGTSLIGLDVLTEIENETGVIIGYQELFDYSVFEDMLNLVMKCLNESSNPAQTDESLSDVEDRSGKYNDYVQQLKDVDYTDRWKFQKVLVTGGTGFLGAFLVDQLLADTTAEVVCLVRGANNEDARARFESQYLKYFETLENERVTIVCGDITTRGLVTDASQKEALSGVQAVYHSAGIVAHYGKYERSHQLNVEGTKNVFDWAVENQVSVFNHMSTLAVSEGKIPGVTQGEFYEFDLDLGQEFNSTIYPKSKFLAEQYITTQNVAMQVNIFRLGNIGGRSDNGLFQTNIETNNVYLMLKAVAQTGKYADVVKDMSIEFEPVDKVVAAISAISALKSNTQSVFHLYDYKRYFMPEIVEAMRASGIEIEETTDTALMAFFQKLSVDGNIGEDYTSIGILKHTFLSDSPLDITHFNIHNEATLECLKNAGVAMNYDRKDYLKQMIKHGIDRGFIPVKETTNTTLG